jgi:hypothetical protein
MRLNSKLKAACLAGVAVVATLAAGEALAGGRGGGWGGGHVIGRPVAGDHRGGVPASAIALASATMPTDRPSPTNTP